MSNKKIKLPLGYKLKRLREKNGLSQDAVANDLGFNIDQLISIEIGEGRISTVVLERLCELYGCSSRDIIDQDNPESIEFTHPLSEHLDDLRAIAAINRIALNLLEMQRLKIVGDQFKSNLKLTNDL